MQGKNRSLCPRRIILALLILTGRDGAGQTEPTEWEERTAATPEATSEETSPLDLGDLNDPSGEKDSPEVFPHAVLDIGQVDVSGAGAFQFHGRLDLTYVYFGDSRNVDDYRRSQIFPLSPGLYGEYEFTRGVFAVAEIEWDGREEEFEVDQAVLRFDLIDELLTLRVGRYYFPFGLERQYYSPSRNELVDRPAPFRQVYPGTFSDNGFFLSGKYHHHTDWTLGYEGAISQGLRGIERDDRPETLQDNNDTPQLGARVFFQPRPELAVGASYTIAYWNDRDDDILDFFGFDLRLQIWELEVRAEYVGGRVEGSPDYAGFFRQGWYVHVEREIELDLPYLEALVPVARIDWIDSNRDVSDFLDVTRYSPGVSLHFPNDIKLKLQGSFSDERGRGDVSNNGFLAQLVYFW